MNKQDSLTHVFTSWWGTSSAAASRAIANAALEFIKEGAPLKSGEGVSGRVAGPAPMDATLVVYKALCRLERIIRDHKELKPGDVVAELCTPEISAALADLTPLMAEPDEGHFPGPDRLSFDLATILRWHVRERRR